MYSILVVLLIAFVLLCHQGFIVLDHSAKQGFEHSVTWKGNTYVQKSYNYSKEGKTLARTDRGFNLKEITDDESHNFLVVRSFLDQYTLVNEDYIIPKSGEVTCVFWDREKFTDKPLTDVISKIINNKKSDFTYLSDEWLSSLTDTRQLDSLDVGYNGCPVGTEYIGYIGKLNNKWVLCFNVKNDENTRKSTCDCYEIPEADYKVLEEYLIIYD